MGIIFIVGKEDGVDCTDVSNNIIFSSDRSATRKKF